MFRLLMNLRWETDTQQIRSILNGLATEIDGRVTQTMEDDRLISLPDILLL